MFRTRYDTDVYSGFLECVFDVDSIRVFDGQLTVQVMVGDQLLGSATVATKDLAEQGSLIIDTYALSDGRHLISVISRYSEVQLSVKIANGHSFRAQFLRSLRKTLGIPSVFFGPIHSEHFGGIQKIADLSADPRLTNEPTSDKLKRFNKDGYLTLSGVIDEKDLKRARHECELIEEQGLFGWAAGSSERIVSAHRELTGIRSVYSNHDIKSMVSELLGEPGFPAQSLLFINGSQQDLHSDWIHLSCAPLNSMVGVWVALEDVQVGSGELVYIPQSHRSRYVDLSELGIQRVTAGPEEDWSEFGRRLSEAVAERIDSTKQLAESFLAKAGDAIFWHENLIHGGSPRLNPGLSRYSLVTHWFSQSCYAWYDSTGIVGNKDIDEHL